MNRLPVSKDGSVETLTMLLTGAADDRTPKSDQASQNILSSAMTDVCLGWVRIKSTQWSQGLRYSSVWSRSLWWRLRSDSKNVCRITCAAILSTAALCFFADRLPALRISRAAAVVKRSYTQFTGRSVACDNTLPKLTACSDFSLASPLPCNGRPTPQPTNCSLRAS